MNRALDVPDWAVAYGCMSPCSNHTFISGRLSNQLVDFHYCIHLTSRRGCMATDKLVPSYHGIADFT